MTKPELKTRNADGLERPFKRATQKPGTIGFFAATP
jgi:hypothetical protein